MISYTHNVLIIFQKAQSHISMASLTSSKDAKRANLTGEEKEALTDSFDVKNLCVCWF